MRHIRPLVLLLCSSIAACGTTMPDVQMKFIDVESNQPIVGANVLFHASAEERTFTGHGGAKVNLFLVETASNDAGEIHIAAQSFWPYPFILGSSYNNPRMTVFKPGYVLVTLLNYRRTFAEREDVTSWQYDKKTIKMQRAGTNKELSHAVEWAAHFAEETYGYLNGREVCAWKQIPNFLVTVDRSVKEWNKRRYLMQEQDLRRREIGSPLQSLLGNEDYLARKGCGSPGKFFDPYLKRANP